MKSQVQSERENFEAKEKRRIEGKDKLTEKTKEDVEAGVQKQL